MRVAGNESRLDLRYNEITWEYCMIVLMAEILHCFGWLVLLNCFASSFWMRSQCEIQKRQLLPRLYDTKLLFVFKQGRSIGDRNMGWKNMNHEMRERKLFC